MPKRLSKKWREIKRKVVSPFAKINSNATIVLGKEKSGTTVIAALLAKLAGQSVILDIPPIWGAAETRIQKGTLKFADFARANRYYFSKDIIKEPCLTFMYPQVTELFGQRKHVMVIRDPRDNIRSILNRTNIAGNLPAMIELDRLPVGWETVFDPQLNHCTLDTHYIDVQAQRWVNTADVYLDNRTNLVLFRYEDFLSDKKKEIENLASQLDIEKRDEIGDQVNKQYQSKGNSDTKWLDFFGAENLTRINSICSSRMLDLGYEPC